MTTIWTWMNAGPIRKFLWQAILAIVLWEVGWRAYNDQRNLDVLVSEYIQRHQPVALPTASPAAPTGS